MRLALSVAVLALLAACSKPEMPDKDKPVEPQAAARHDDLERAIREPLDRTKDAQAAADAAGKAQDEALEAATGQ